jgi:hypothetical protein
MSLSAKYRQMAETLGYKCSIENSSRLWSREPFHRSVWPRLFQSSARHDLSFSFHVCVVEAASGYMVGGSVACEMCIHVS